MQTSHTRGFFYFKNMERLHTQLQITKGNSYSYLDIAASHCADRSAHVGNISGSSQNVVTHTKTNFLLLTGNYASDPTYNPTGVITHGETRHIANGAHAADTLTPFVPVDTTKVREVAEQFDLPDLREARSIAQVHIAGLESVYGSKRIETIAGLMTTEQGKVVLHALAPIDGACDRLLTLEGRHEKCVLANVEPSDLVRTMTSLSNSAVLGNPILPIPGPYLSNAATLVAHAFIRALPYVQDGQPQEILIMHSSGPDMIKYAFKPKFYEEVQRIAHALSQNLQLPDGLINMVIFPAREYVMFGKDTPELRDAFQTFSAMVDCMIALEPHHNQANDNIRSQAIINTLTKHGIAFDPTGKLIKEAKRAIDQLAVVFHTQISAVNQSTFNYEPRELTQWDVRHAGVPLIMPEALRGVSVDRVIHYTKIAKLIHEKGPNQPFPKWYQPSEVMQ